MSEERDHVDLVIAQWATERPDLDVTPTGVIGRLHRVAMRLTDELVETFQRFGLGEGEFDVLATLRRSGPPFEMTPGELGRATMVSSGAVSKRVDRCVQQGWVSRRTSDADGRSRVVALTRSGRELIDEAFTAHIANEHRLVAPLTQRQREALRDALTAWARALDA